MASTRRNGAKESSLTSECRQNSGEKYDPAVHNVYSVLSKRARARVADPGGEAMASDNSGEKVFYE